MVQDLSYNLCESLVENIDGVSGATSRKVVVATPVITLTDNSVTITCDTTGATIYYTLDGSTPTSSSSQYSSAFTLDSSCTIKAIAIKGGKSSGVAEESYVKPITYLTQWNIVGNSEVHTLPYPDGVILPNGYKRCEYLTFDGNSYINTGVKTANDIGYNLACSYNVGTQVLIGARTSGSSNGFGLGYGYIAYGGASASKSVLYSSSKVNVLLDATQCKVGNNNYDINDIKATATTFLDIYVGTWNQNGSPDSRMWTGNIYDTIIYNTQGELWHGIPCLDANDVPCFYDIVSQTAFYNQGSGSFTYKLYPQSTEIWSCGEYNATDGKYHILVQPQGGSIADIALTEPLRKVNNVADSIEFPSGTEGKALVTRNLKPVSLEGKGWNTSNAPRYVLYIVGREYDFPERMREQGCIMCSTYSETTYSNTYNMDKSIGIAWNGSYNLISIKDTDVVTPATDITGEAILKLTTPTTELVDAPQIAEADSYSMVISQGGKAVEWSSFEME